MARDLYTSHVLQQPASQNAISTWLWLFVFGTQGYQLSFYQCYLLGG